jgi:hypothetical protein
MNWTMTLMLAFLLQQVQQEDPMERASRAAELFLRQFPAVQCVERVVQTRFNAAGKVTATQTSQFDYVAILKPKGTGLAVDESRVAKAGAAAGLRNELLLTSGFPTFLVMFHPDFQDRFEFEFPPGADAGTLTPVRFKSRPNARAMSALKLKERVYPILWTGVAWLERSTGVIVRIEAGLSAPMEDLGLSELLTDVEYGAVQLDGVSWWLPRRAVISVRTAHQAWQNVHEFSGYRVFSVTTTTRQSESK